MLHACSFCFALALGQVEGWRVCVTLVPTEERACFLGLDCHLADPTTKAAPYWQKLGFRRKGGDIWAKHPVETKNRAALICKMWQVMCHHMPF